MSCHKLQILILLAIVFRDGSQVGSALTSASEEKLILPARSIQKATIALDSRGRPHVVSDQGREGKKIFYSYLSGDSWMVQELRPPGKIIARISEPKIVIDYQDNAYVSYWYYEALASGSRIGCGFQQFLSLDTPKPGKWIELGRGASPVLNVDAKGMLHVHWRASGREFHHQIFDGTTPLTEPRNFFLVDKTFPNDPDAGCSSGNDSDISLDGVLHMACSSQEIGLLYSNTARAEKGLGVQIIAKPVSVGCCHEWTVCSLAVDRKDPEIVYIIFGGGNNRAYLIQHRQGRWSPPRLLVREDSEQSEKRTPPMVRALPGGGAVAAWMDNSSGNFETHLGRISPEGEVGPIRNITRGKNPRFIIGPRGEVHLVYTREGNLYYRMTSLP